MQQRPLEIPPVLNPDPEIRRQSYEEAYAKGEEALYEWWRPHFLGRHGETLEAERYNLVNLAKSLKKPIEEHRWDSMLGDDLSGRTPAVFVHRLMKRYAQESGTKVPTLMYLAPEHKPHWKKRKQTIKKRLVMKDYLKARQNRLGKRTLVVTEFIASGRNIRDILKAFPRKTAYDVASVAVMSYFEDPNTELRKLKRLPGQMLFYGGTTKKPDTLLFKATEVLGRKKDEFKATSFRSEYFDPQRTQAARQMVVDMADEIYEQVFHTAEKADIDQLPNPNPALNLEAP